MVLPRYFEVPTLEGYFALDVVQFMFRKFDQPFDRRSEASRLGSCRDSPFDHRIAEAMNVIFNEIEPHTNLVFVSFLESNKSNISEVYFGNFIKKMALLLPLGGFLKKAFLYYCTTVGSMAARLHWMGRKLSGHFAVKVLEDAVIMLNNGNPDWEALQEFAGNYVDSRRRGTNVSEQEGIIDVGLNSFTANQDPEDSSSNQSQGESRANQGQDYFPASQDRSANPVQGATAANPVHASVHVSAKQGQGDATVGPVQVDATADPVQGDATVGPVQGNATVGPVQVDATEDPVHVAAILDPGQGEAPTNQRHGDATEDLVQVDATEDPVHVAAILDPGQGEAPTNQGYGDATEDPVQGGATENPIQGGATVHSEHPVTAYPRQLCVTAYSIKRVVIAVAYWNYGATYLIKRGVIVISYRKHGVTPFSWKSGVIFFPIKPGAIFYPGQLGVLIYSMQNSSTTFAAQNIVSANYKMLSYFRNIRRLAQSSSERGKLKFIS